MRASLPHLNIQDLVTLVDSLVVVLGLQLDGGDIENTGNLHGADSGNQDFGDKFTAELSLQFLLVIIRAADSVAEQLDIFTTLLVLLCSRLVVSGPVESVACSSNLFTYFLFFYFSHLSL